MRPSLRLKSVLSQFEVLTRHGAVIFEQEKQVHQPEDEVGPFLQGFCLPDGNGKRCQFLGGHTISMLKP